MYLAMDSNAEGHGPIYYSRPFAAFFFVMYIAVVGVFMMDIFVAFVINIFNHEGEQRYRNCQLDENQVLFWKYSIMRIIRRENLCWPAVRHHLEGAFGSVFMQR